VLNGSSASWDHIETAAGGAKKADVELAALSRADALALRERLRPAAQTAAPAPDEAAAAMPAAAAPEASLIRTLSTRDLLLAGATSARVGPALAVVVGALQLADDILRRPLPALLGIDAPSSPSGLAVLLVIFALGSWLLAIGSTVLTYARFELRRDGERLLISHGLLDRRRRSVPLARIQALRLTENLLRQPFGLAGLGFESAGYGPDAAGSGVLFPLLPLRVTRPPGRPLRARRRAARRRTGAPSRARPAALRAGAGAAGAGGGRVTLLVAVERLVQPGGCWRRSPSSPSPPVWVCSMPGHGLAPRPPGG
jgi:putative membrane protein